MLESGHLSSAYRNRQTFWQHGATLTGGMSVCRPARRGTRSTFLALLVVVATLMGVLGGCSLAGRSLPASPSGPQAQSINVEQATALPSHGPLGGAVTGDIPNQPRTVGPGAIGVADGEVPDGVTVFDNRYPAVTNLDPSLLDALRQAATTAGVEGVKFYVNSGWRSPAYQEQLLAQAVSKYGSRTEAARWVATPATSAHVSGDAVDIGHPGAATWLSEHGSEYGLCLIYRNEPWHFELRPVAVDDGCPAVYADPTQDPRMHG